jgi:hypothetical protein
MLSLFNGTGQELFIDNLDGVEVNFYFLLFSLKIFFYLSIKVR